MKNVLLIRLDRIGVPANSIYAVCCIKYNTDYTGVLLIQHLLVGHTAKWKQLT